MTNNGLKQEMQSTEAVEKSDAPTEYGANLVFWLFGLSGVAALIYEVVWTRALSLVLGSTTYALSTMLASFMAGLSLGAIFGGWLADRFKKTVLLFIMLEAGIGISGILIIPLINILPSVYVWIFYALRQSFSSFSIIQFIICFAIMLIPTTLMGATFPVVCRLNFKDRESIGRETGSVYAINTVGAIIGALLAGFMLIPAIGVKWTNTFAALVNISIALLVSGLYFYGREKWKNIANISILFISAVMFSIFVKLDTVYPFNYYTTWRFASYEEFMTFGMQSYKKLYDKDNAQGNVQVFETPVGRFLVTNGKVESDTMFDLQNTALLAYLPASLNPDAKSFLNIGLGTGSTLYFASTLSNLKDIFSIEINPSVERAVRLYFYPELFNDRRIKFITADARNYLMLVDKRYDIISSEPSYPVDQGFSHLFSIEFFELVKKRLNENGAFCQWIPRYLLKKDDRAMILKTFTTVFPNTSVWRLGDDVIFLGSAGNNEQRIEDIVNRTDSWLKGQGLISNYAIRLKGKRLEDAVKGYTGRLNTDDFPILEFNAARNMINKFD